MPYTILMLSLGVALTLSLVLAARALNQLRARGQIALSMAVLMLAVSGWIIAHAIELGSSNPQLKFINAQLKFIGVVIVPLAWLAFSVYYTGSDWLTRRRLALLSIMPLLTMIAVLTDNSLHGMWQERRIVSAGDFTVVHSIPGVWFWIHAAYSYLLILAGGYLLLRKFIISPDVYRRQLLALLVAVAAPFAANAITIFSATFLDFTPFAFVITGLALTWGLMRYHLLDVVPIARNAVIDNMSDGLIVIDPQERIVDINPAARRILTTDTSAIGKPITQVVELLTRRPQIAERFRATDTIQDELRLGSGENQQYFDVRVSLLRDRSGQITGRMIVFRDITERKQDEQRIQAQNEALLKANHELEFAREQAEQATRLKSEFLATISHELRTPLNAILGFTELQLMGMVGEINKQQKEYLGRTLANAQHLLGMINDLLDLSKIEAGRMELFPRPFQLRALLDAITQEYSVLADQKGLRFEVRVDEAMPEMLVCDSQRLKQVIVNLLSNAIKFTSEGFVRIEVYRDDATHWRIVVTDSGIGIAPEQQQIIFDEFRQVDGSYRRQYGGTGLGLAIVRRLMALMDGMIHVESEVGKGSAFTVTLPLIEAVDTVPDTSC